MEKKIKEIATISVILLALLGGVFFLIYKEYEDTFDREKKVIEISESLERELLKSIYYSLKRESQYKTDRLAQEIRRELKIQYKYDTQGFIFDYDNIKVNSRLSIIVDDVINSEENRFFYVESDANDMFATTTKQILADRSQDCSIDGQEDDIRTLEEEKTMHFNKYLVSEAIDAMLLGNNEHIFWRFRNTSKSKNIGLKEMNIDEVLNLKMEEIKDYEFLTVSYIDKYEDIIGRDSVNSIGQKQVARKIMIVQGFNIYEQIQKNYVSQFAELEKNKKIQLMTIYENRKSLSTKLVMTLLIIFISFFAIANLQNSYVKGCERKDGKC